MIPTRLVFIPVSADLPAAVVIVGADGAVAAQPSLTLDTAADLKPMRTLAIAPGADVLVRRLVLPVGSAAQVRAAALWALRADLAAPADRLSVALCPPVKEGEPRTVAVVATALVQAWSDYLASLGVRPEAIVPDNLILPAPHEAKIVSRRDLGADVVLCGSNLAVTTQIDLADIMAEGLTVDPVDDARWARALASTAVAPPLDLRAAPSRSSSAPGRKAWRLPIGLAAGLLVSPLLLTIAGGLRDTALANGARERTATIITTSAPELAEAENPAAEVRRRAEVALPLGVGQASAALFAAIEGVEGAEIDALSFEPARGLSATISYPAFQDLDALRKAMAAAGYGLTDESTVEDNGRIVSGVLIGRGG